MGYWYCECELRGGDGVCVKEGAWRAKGLVLCEGRRVKQDRMRGWWVRRGSSEARWGCWCVRTYMYGPVREAKG